jgi:hypothetical protein
MSSLNELEKYNLRKVDLDRKKLALYIIPTDFDIFLAM